MSEIVLFAPSIVTHLFSTLRKKERTTYKQQTSKSATCLISRSSRVYETHFYKIPKRYLHTS